MVNVKDPPYHATGDGAADDTCALQAALNAADAVYLPAGVYRFGNLTLPLGRRIWGDGSATVLQQTGAGIGIAVPMTGNADLSLSHFAVRSGNPLATHAIALTNLYRVTFEGIDLIGEWQGGRGYSEAALLIASVGPHNSSGIRVTGCRIKHTIGDGIRITAAEGAGGSGIWITENLIEAGGGWGVNVPADVNIPSSVQIERNIIEGNMAGQVNGDALFASTIAGNHFEQSSGQSTPPLVFGRNGACSALTIRGNIVAGVAAEYGIAMDGGGGSPGVVIEGNHFAGASVAAIYLRAVQGARISGNSKDATVGPWLKLGPDSRGIRLEDVTGEVCLPGPL